MSTKIKAKKDMFNNGKCFSAGNEYIVNKEVSSRAGLYECATTNDLKENHLIGNWWRNFEIVNKK